MKQSTEGEGLGEENTYNFVCLSWYGNYKEAKKGYDYVMSNAFDNIHNISLWPSNFEDDME